MAGVTKNWDPNEQWDFPEGDISEVERKKIIAKVVEIAVIALFENFSYKFGGKNYKQKSGGPIGVRATGAASQLTMEDWAEEYIKILINSGLWVAMMGGFVDDGRQVTTQLQKGARFDGETKTFKYSEEGYKEDAELEKAGESKK